MEYKHTKEMGEISGFGSHSTIGKLYEAACQNMLDAGVKWLLKNGNPEIKLKSYDESGGVIEAGKMAQELSDTIVAVAAGCTGAMHDTVMRRLQFISRNGWDKYCEELTKEEIHAEKEALQG